MRNRQRAFWKGFGAEYYAAIFLRLCGYRVLHRRYKSPVGEVDLILFKNKVLVMVEVKYRRATTKHDALPLQDAQISKDKGLNSRQNGLDDAVFAVTDHSRRRISRAAGLFISQNPGFASMGLRYDIVAISGFSIRHLKDAWRD